MRFYSSVRSRVVLRPGICAAWSRGWWGQRHGLQPPPCKWRQRKRSSRNPRQDDGPVAGEKYQTVGQDRVADGRIGAAGLFQLQESGTVCSGSARQQESRNQLRLSEKRYDGDGPVQRLQLPSGNWDEDNWHEDDELGKIDSEPESDCQ